jgi:hypothetical protein
MGKVTTRIRQPLPGETVFGGRGLLIPFRPSSETSTKPSGADSAPPSSPALPAHDDPAFEELHRQGVREYLRAQARLHHSRKGKPK